MSNRPLNGCQELKVGQKFKTLVFSELIDQGAKVYIPLGPQVKTRAALTTHELTHTL